MLDLVNIDLLLSKYRSLLLESDIDLQDMRNANLTGSYYYRLIGETQVYRNIITDLEAIKTLG